MRLPQVEDQQVGLGPWCDSAQIGAAERIGTGLRARAHELVRGSEVRLAEMLLRHQARGAHLRDEVHAVRIGAEARVDAGTRKAGIREIDALAREAECAV